MDDELSRKGRGDPWIPLTPNADKWREYSDNLIDKAGDIGFQLRSYCDGSNIRCDPEMATLMQGLYHGEDEDEEDEDEDEDEE